jgi:hypothetical protein
MLSMIVVGPKEYATAWIYFHLVEILVERQWVHTYIPKAAAVPFVVVAQFARHMERKTPAPQTTTARIPGQFGSSSRLNHNTD